MQDRCRCLITLTVLVGLSFATAAGAAPDGPQLTDIPFPNLTGLDPGVQDALNEAKQEFERRAGDLNQEELTQFYGQLGMLYHAHQLLDAAEVCYRNATTLDPSDSRWIHLLALILEDTGRLEEANRAYDRVLALNDKYVPARLHRAANLLSLGQYAEAGKRYQALAKELPEQAAVLAGLGRVAANRGEPEQAVAYYEKALNAEPAAAQLHYLLAIEYRKLGDREKAQHHAKLRGTRQPSIPDPLGAAMASLSRSSQYYMEAGYAAFREGNHEGALQAFKRAVEVSPDDAATHLSLGRAHSLLGDYEAAKLHFRKAVELEPDHAVANYRLGTVLEHERQEPEAIEHYRSAIAANPDYFQARLLFANALMRVGRYQEAAEQYAQTHQAGSDPTLFLYREGLAYLAANKCARAAEPLERALQANPGSGEVLEALARTYSTCAEVSSGNRQRGLELARRLYEAVPDSQRAQTMAMACAANGLSQEAVEYQTQSAFEALKQGTLEQQPSITRNLERYRAGQSAHSAWPAGDPIFNPPRFDLQEQPGDLAPEQS